MESEAGALRPRGQVRPSLQEQGMRIRNVNPNIIYCTDSIDFLLVNLLSELQILISMAHLDITNGVEGTWEVDYTNWGGRPMGRGGMLMMILNI